MHTTCLDSLHSLCIALNLGGMRRLWLADSIGGAGVAMTKLCSRHLIVGGIYLGAYYIKTENTLEVPQKVPQHNKVSVNFKLVKLDNNY